MTNICPVCGKQHIISYKAQYKYMLVHNRSKKYYCCYSCYLKDKEKFDNDRKYKLTPTRG